MNDDRYLLKDVFPKEPEITRLTKSLDKAYLDRINKKVESVLYAIGRIYKYAMPFLIKFDVAVQKLDDDKYLQRVHPNYYGHVSFYSRYEGSNVSLRIDGNWLLTIYESLRIKEDSVLSIVIMHEVMHVLLSHLTQLRQILYQATNKGFDPETIAALSNLVGDAMVYAFLEEFFNPIREFGTKIGHITPDDLKELNITRYDLINKSLYQIIMELLYKTENNNGAASYIKTIIQSNDGKGSKIISSTIVEKEASVDSTERQLQIEASKNWGDMPGDLKVTLGKLLKYKEPWDIGLSKSVSNLFYDQYSMSRQHPFYKYNSDLIIGCFTGNVNKLVLGLDVSGSMIEDLPYYVSRIGHVLSIKGLTELYVLTGDVRVTFKKLCKIPFSDKDMDEISRSLRGGGGTDFRPLFKEAYKFWEKNKSSMLGFVLFTDTYGDFPHNIPPYDTIIVTKEYESSMIPKWVNKVIPI